MSRLIREGLTGKSRNLFAGAAVQQPINQAARNLDRQNHIKRQRRADGLIGNFPVEYGDSPVSPGGEKRASKAIAKNHDVDALSEDGIKEILDAWLTARGWTTKVAWGHARGIDIEASKDGERWVIEVKGPGSRPQMRVNYFLSILGETLQRMNDADARYSIALPDLGQYRRLWERLPKLAKLRTGISAIFVSEAGEIRVDG